MSEKVLGKISNVKFGLMKDYPFLMGLDLTFDLADGGCVGTGCKYTVNLNEKCKWVNEQQKNEAILKMVKHVEATLKKAKVDDVRDLLNKPVEVTIKNRTFEDFRILTEVL